MWWKQCWFVLFIFEANSTLLCYNCSATHRDWNPCGGDFAPSNFPFNTTRKLLINCTGENAMCFVRSWAARARPAWIVQRGCYLPTEDDTLPSSLKNPTRSMTCKQERYSDAEYKVCLCQADWCNSASTAIPSIMQYLMKLPRHTAEYVTAIYKPLSYVCSYKSV